MAYDQYTERYFRACPRGPGNILDQLTDSNLYHPVSNPTGRRWRVVALDGVGPRPGDVEVRKVLANGALLRVAETGEVWYDLTDCTGAGSYSLPVTIEADDGQVLLSDSGGSPCVRGQGTQLTTSHTFTITNYTPSWTPATSGASFVLSGYDETGFTFSTGLTGPTWEASTFTQRNSYRQQARESTSAPTQAGKDAALANIEANWQNLDEYAGRYRSATAYTANGRTMTTPATTRLGRFRRSEIYRAFQAQSAGHLDATISGQTICALVYVGQMDRDVATRPICAAEGGGSLQISAATGLTNSGLTGVTIASRRIDGVAGNGQIFPHGWHFIVARLSAPVSWRSLFTNIPLQSSGNLMALWREVAFFPTSLSDADCESWEGYAAHRYGIADRLPNNHPYRWGPPGFATPATEPTPLPATAVMGNRTRAGFGGIPVPFLTPPASITSGNTSGHFQLLNGKLCPTAAFVTAQPANGTVYTLGFNTGASITVTIVGGVAHVAPGKELVSMLAAAPSNVTAILPTDGTAQIQFRAGFHQGFSAMNDRRISNGGRTTLIEDRDARGRVEINPRGQFTNNNLNQAWRLSGTMRVRSPNDDLLDWSGGSFPYWQTSNGPSDVIGDSMIWPVTVGGAYIPWDVQNYLLGKRRLRSTGGGATTSARYLKTHFTDQSGNWGAIRDCIFWFRFGDGPGGPPSAIHCWIAEHLFDSRYGGWDGHVDGHQFRAPNAAVETQVRVSHNVYWQSSDNGARTEGLQGAIFLEGPNETAADKAIFHGAIQNVIAVSALSPFNSSIASPVAHTQGVAVRNCTIAHNEINALNGDRNIAPAQRVSSGRVTNAVNVSRGFSLEGTGWATYFDAPALPTTIRNAYDVIRAVTPIDNGPLDIVGGVIGAVGINGAWTPPAAAADIPLPPRHAQTGVSLANEGGDIRVTVDAAAFALNGGTSPVYDLIFSTTRSGESPRSSDYPLTSDPVSSGWTLRTNIGTSFLLTKAGNSLTTGQTLRVKVRVTASNGRSAFSRNAVSIVVP